MDKIKLFGVATKYRRVLASIVIAIGLLVITKSLTTTDTSELLVAARDIPTGAIIQESDVKLVRTTYAWKDMMSKQELVQLRYSLVPIKAGAPLLKSLLRTHRILDAANPKSVSVSLPISVSAQSLQHQDRVNVFGLTNEGTAVLVAEHALVIGIEKTKRQANLSSGDGVIELAVSLSSAEKIAEIDDSGFMFVKLPS